MPTKYGFETAQERAERENKERQAVLAQMDATRRRIDAAVRDILEDYYRGALGLSIPMVMADAIGQRNIWRARGHRQLSAVSEMDPRSITVELVWDAAGQKPALSVAFAGAQLWPEQDRLLEVLQSTTGLLATKS